MAGLNEIARAAGIRVEFVQEVFDAVIRVLQEEGVKHVVVRGFGTFRLVHKKGRAIRTPQVPGGVAQELPHIKLGFRPSPISRAILNGQQAVAKGIKSEVDPAEVILKTRNRKPKSVAPPEDEGPEE